MRLNNLFWITVLAHLCTVSFSQIWIKNPFLDVEDDNGADNKITPLSDENVEEIGHGLRFDYKREVDRGALMENEDKGFMMKKRDTKGAMMKNEDIGYMMENEDKGFMMRKRDIGRDRVLKKREVGHGVRLLGENANNQEKRSIMKRSKHFPA